MYPNQTAVLAVSEVSPENSSQSWPVAWRIAALMLAYVALAQLTLSLRLPPSVAAIFWPVAGFAVAALLLLGRSCWPGVWLGAVASGLISLSAKGGISAQEVAFAATTASGVTLQAFIGARLLQPLYHGIVRPDDKSPLMLPSLLTIPVVCLLSATAGCGALFWFNAVPLAELMILWLTGWTGDTLAVLLVVPFMMAGVLHKQHGQVRAAQVVLLPLLIAALAMGGYHWLSHSEQMQQQSKLEARGQDLSLRLKGLYVRQSQSVAALADLIAARGEVSRAELTDFTRRTVNDAGVAWLGWAPREPAAGRSVAESVYPLRYLAGQPDTAVGPGFDFSAVEAYRVALMGAMDSAKPVQVLPHRSATRESGASPDRLLFIPVYPADFDARAASSEARRRVLLGFAVGSLSMQESLLPELVSQGHPNGLAARLSADVSGAASSASWLEFQLSPDGERAPDWVGRLEADQETSLELQLWSLSPWRHGQSANAKTWLVGGVLAVLLATLLTLRILSQQLRIRREEARRTLELSDARARLQRVMDGSQLGFWDWDLVNNAIIYSGGWASMLGYRLDALKPTFTTWSDRIHPDDRDQALQVLNDLLQGRTENYEFEYRLRHQSGEWRWILTRGSAVSRSASGKPLFVSGTHADIHEKKQLELALKASDQQLLAANANLERQVVERTAQLRESERFMRALIDALSVHVAVLDEQGVVLTSNASWRAFAPQNGQPCGRISEGMNYLEVCDTDGQGAAAAALIREVMQGSRAQGAYEYSSQQADETCWFLCKVTRFDVEGAARVVLAHENITLRKRAEIALKRLNDELEGRVLARTDQLQQARQGAEQASQAKSQFLATMSHEIRTPLNGVIGMVDVLEQTSLEPAQKDMLDLIRISGLSLLEIIDDILDFSKIEAGHLELNQGPFSASALVEQCCAMLDNQASNKGVELRLFTDPAVPETAIGDELRIRQIVLNLANNAVKFSSEQEGGRVSVRLVLESRTAQQLWLAFQIEDNGIGMDETTQASLFTAFKQADATTTRRFGGTGLGLAISLHLVKMMQGEIQVRSEPGKGSVFTVRLPLTLPAGPDAQQPAPSPIEDLRCLVIGSPASLANDLYAYLAHAGSEVAQVPDLAAAREWQQRAGTGLCVWVVDIERQAREIAGFELSTTAVPGQEVRYVLIERGQRRQPRMASADRVEVDGNVLTRKMLLAAVTFASGRKALAALRSGAPAKNNGTLTPPSRAEALWRGCLILIAEDNKVNQKVLTHQLGLLGYTADIASNGREALELWRSGDYALLLTDLHMPEMDGYQLTAGIRAEQTDANRIPIIALTANALKGEAQRCQDIGMDGFLSKPARLEVLRAMLEKWMPNADSEPEPSGGTAPVSAPQSSGAKKAGPYAPTLDTSALASIVGDDPDIIQELLQDFRDYGRKTAEALLRAYENGEIKDVGAIAHKLKSSALSVGAMRLGEHCAGLESAARDEDRTAMAKLIPLLRSEIFAVDQAIAVLCR